MWVVPPPPSPHAGGVGREEEGVEFDVSQGYTLCWVMSPFQGLVQGCIYLGLPHSTPFFENGGEMGVCV